jgi:hypothetical protein
LWIGFTITTVELREVNGVRWLAIDYLDDVHGDCQKSFPWETTIPGFKAETRTSEFFKEPEDTSPAVRHQRVEYRLPDSVSRPEAEVFATNVRIELNQKSFRLAMGEEKTLFDFYPEAGGSLKARIKVLPPLKIPEPAVSPEYRRAAAQLESALQREQKLSAENYSEDNPLVKRVREQIEDARKKLKRLEPMPAEKPFENPAISGVPPLTYAWHTDAPGRPIASGTTTGIQSFAFAPSVERVLYDYKSGKDWLLNLDSGETFSLPPGMSWDNDAAAVWKWAHQRGIHVTGLNVASQHGLYGFELKAAIVRETNVIFEAITPMQITAALRGPLTSKSTHNGGPSLHQLSGQDWKNLFAFETDEGLMGVLQVTGFVDNPRGIKFRYKLVEAKNDRAGTPPLDITDGKNDGTQRRITLARQQLEAVQELANAGRVSRQELAEARRDLRIAEARGDAVMEAQAKLKFAEEVLQAARKLASDRISSQEMRRLETQQAVAEIELQQALRKMPVKPSGPAPQKPDAAALQFRLVADGTDNDSPVDLLVQSRQKGPGEQLRVLRSVLLDGSSVARAGVDFDARGSRVISVELTAEGARQFGAITAANINRQLAIIADGKVLSAPIIRAAITGGQLQISGDMPVTEMYELLGSLNGNPTGLQFSPPVERSLPRARETRTEAVGLDLDLGTYITNRSFSTDRRTAIFSFETNGVDLLAAGTNEQPASLVALGSVLIEAPVGAWDSMPAEAVGWNWKLMRTTAKEYSRFGVAPGGSDTFMFRTHENGFGVLQFLPATNSAPNVNIRYKLVQALPAK